MDMSSSYQMSGTPPEDGSVRIIGGGGGQQGHRPPKAKPKPTPTKKNAPPKGGSKNSKGA